MGIGAVVVAGGCVVVVTSVAGAGVVVGAAGVDVVAATVVAGLVGSEASSLHDAAINVNRTIEATIEVRSVTLLARPKAVR